VNVILFSFHAGERASSKRSCQLLSALRKKNGKIEVRRIKHLYLSFLFAPLSFHVTPYKLNAWKSDFGMGLIRNIVKSLFWSSENFENREI